ncbi:MAG: formylglycine-generating enzyme family protein [Planctomycetota bacterium]
MAAAEGNDMPHGVQAPRGMVFVPAAEVALGSDQDFDQNPRRTVRIPPFFLDIHPVTNAQYAEFVAATGHRAPKHWRGETPSSEQAKHPVVWLSWFDAQAYARWADKRLPTEDEWEYAARGTDGRPYPWGNDFSPERCNCRATGLGGTSPIASFPDGLSPFGCHDMVGNVWEWTDAWADPDQQQRVLRGGSWGSGTLTVRACFRGADYPTYWSNGYGVRCARSRLP